MLKGYACNKSTLTQRCSNAFDNGREMAENNVGK